jgi:alkanesulfonate monooxygenase SsuD/methylene tetrahydromethanopterin reductase-like flavin-dependent oxidoreductase (luciferase family)/kynurenine formamidase
MHLGVWYDFRNPLAWRIPWQQLYHETLDQASWAEELGFHSVWLSEHHFTDDGYMPSIPSALAAIASRTTRVRLGTAVILAPLHHPLRLAEDLAVVDLISDGRLDIGLAAGYRSKEFEVMAVPRRERGQRTEETVQLLRLAWTGEEFDFEGKSYRFHDVTVTPPPAQPSGPPLYLGGSSVPAARRAGRLGCGFAADSGGSLDLYRVYAEAFTVVAGGLPAPDIKTNRLVYVAADPERAWHMLGPHLLHQSNVYARWAREAGDPGARPADLTDPDQLSRDSFLVGTPQQVLDGLNAVFAEGPVSELIFWARPPGVTLDDSAASLQLIADQILPALAAGAATSQGRRLSVENAAGNARESPAPDVTERTNWDRWGPDDEVGALNLISPSDVVQAARLVRTGKTFTLGLRVFDERGDPLSAERHRALHVSYRDWSHYASGKAQVEACRPCYADDGIFISCHGTTHMDALGHIWVDDQLYNGYPAQTTAGSLERCSIAPISQRGVVTRGVLLDVASGHGVRYLPPKSEITLGELLSAAADGDVEVGKGDVVLIRTGSLPRFYEVGPDEFWSDYSEPGLSDDPELLEWIDRTQIAGIGTDTLANELPHSVRSDQLFPLHRLLLRNRGLTFHEALWLEELAEDSRADGCYAGLYVALPLKLVGATASPMNPLFVK